MADDEQWVDLPSAVAMTGAPGSAIAWAMAQGDVTYSTTLPGHERIPMVLVDDVHWLASALRVETDRRRAVGPSAG
jgi:hypothetical protein